MTMERARRALSARATEPAARSLARLGVPAHAVTVLGLAVAGGSAYLVSAGHLLEGGIVLLASSVFDLLDGAVARAAGRVTRFGALLDSAVDRVSEAVVLLGVVLFYLDRDSSPGVVLAYLALAASFMVSYLRARAEGLGAESNVGIMTRTERVLALAAGLIIGDWWTDSLKIALGVIAFLSLFTAGERLVHGWRTLGTK